MHDHQLDCIYLGRDAWKRVFLDQAPTGPTSERKIPWKEVQQGFPEQHQVELRELLQRHAAVFDDSGLLRETKFIEHDIVLKDSASKKKAIQEHVRDVLKRGIIQASLSIVMAPKKNESFRLSVDFRRLNTITEDSAQPLPVIHAVLKDHGEATIFSTLDLRSGYWQKPLTKKARKFTAFVTPDGGQ